MTAARPVLFLDVDGPLLPFGAGTTPPAPDTVGTGNPLLSRLRPELGPRLLSLGCDLVWATTWLDEANEVLAPRLGLPELPVVRWAEDAGVRGPRGLRWKTAELVAWAGARPFLWVDDEIGPMDRLWVEAQHPGPALLHRVDPGRGLADADFTALARFTAGLRRSGRRA
ncbi:HAD domain-containing protein [Streptomyces abyssomicinicus]|uniref:HAD domain-containing protein n=1 Tax=Streptomyces abyssomicinicus TaxID=574929 RepID=UPI00124F900B|nr:HAD domain-containing protein [Streptomyces abyssomicinicus]